MRSDAEQLAELGYESHFERRMGLWENFALGFTYLSPVVGIYSVFALGFVAGGPPMIWSIVIAGLGQLLVALVFLPETRASELRGRLTQAFRFYGRMATDRVYLPTALGMAWLTAAQTSSPQPSASSLPSTPATL